MCVAYCQRQANSACFWKDVIRVRIFKVGKFLTVSEPRTVLPAVMKLMSLITILLGVFVFPE